MFSQLRAILSPLFWAMLFGFVALFIYNAIPQQEITQLADLPDYDYLPELQQHVKDKEYKSAMELAEYMVKSDLPNKEKAQEIHAQVDKRLNSNWGRGLRFTSGFVTGQGSTPLELTGAIASDMLVIGDLRDIGIQSFNWLRGEPVDKVIFGLSIAGIALEVAAPSALGIAIIKTVAKLGALTKPFIKMLVRILEPVIQAGGKLTKEAKAVFSTGGKAIKSLGPNRTALALKYVHHTDELGKIAAVGAKNPDVVARTLQNSAKLGEHGGRYGVKLLSEHGVTHTRLLETAARKGPQGIDWLKDPGKYRSYVVRARVGARALKVLHTEKPQQLLGAWMQQHPYGIWIGWVAFVMAALLAIYHCVMIILSFIPTRREPRPPLVQGQAG